MRKLLRFPLHFYFSSFFFLFVFALYLHNITYDIYSGDIGDLVTAAYVFGVPHPSGYPLFTFLGFLFSHLPLSIPVVTKISLISIISSLTGLILFYLYSFKITKSRFFALLSTAILSFSVLFWVQAEIPEVFGLNDFFTIALLTLAYFYYKTKKVWYLYIFSLVTGLSFTHHQSIILLYPGIILLLLPQLWQLLRNKLKIILKALLFFAIGLIPLLYIPIAASTHPIINWDNVTTVHNFIHLFLRKDYGTAPTLTNAIPVIIKLTIVKDFFVTLVNTFSYQIVFLTLAGAIGLFIKDKLFFTSLIITFIITGPFFLFYGGSIIGSTSAWGIVERFYVMPMIVLAFFFPFGFNFLKQLLSRFFSNLWLVYILLGYFLLIPIDLVWFNMPKTDLSHTQIGNTLAYNTLKQLPKNTVLLVGGDETTFSTWYVHYVLGFRPDVTLIDSSAVETNFLDDEVNRYHDAHPNVPLSAVFNKTLDQIKKERPVYATFVPENMFSNSRSIPHGLVYEIAKAGKSSPKQQYLSDFEAKWKQITIYRRDNLTPAEMHMNTPGVPMIYSNGLVRVGDYLDNNYHDPATAEQYYRRALWIDDTNPAAYSGLALSLYKAYHNCSGAMQNLQQAINLYPVWKDYYGQQYIIANRCKLSQSTVKRLQNIYYSTFRENIMQNQLVKLERKRNPNSLNTNNK